MEIILEKKYSDDEDLYREMVCSKIKKDELRTALGILDSFPWSGYKKIVLTDKRVIFYLFRNGNSGATCVCDADRNELNGDISARDYINYKYPQTALHHINFIRNNVIGINERMVND